MRWQDIYEALPNKRRVGLGWEPPLPLLLAAWWEASPDEKRDRFLEHLKWAEDHDCLERIEAIMARWVEEDWLQGA